MNPACECISLYGPKPSTTLLRTFTYALHLCPSILRHKHISYLNAILFMYKPVIFSFRCIFGNISPSYFLKENNYELNNNSFCYFRRRYFNFMHPINFQRVIYVFSVFYKKKIKFIITQTSKDGKTQAIYL